MLGKSVLQLKRQPDRREFEAWLALEKR